MSKQQRAGKLKEPKETDKDQLQCDIPTEIVEPDQSNDLKKKHECCGKLFQTWSECFSLSFPS